MENKCLKKSTMSQLKTLVQHMEEHPELARGIPVFGATKLSVEEEWTSLCKSLNSIGPPTRSISEWKETWADLKSRTKKKLADNKKSLRETGGGLYRYSNLTELEVIIDRTLCLSSAAAPSGEVFGCEAQSIEECFVALVESPPRGSKTVAVVTPNRKENQTTVTANASQLNAQQLQEKPQFTTSGTKRKQSDTDNEQPACHSAKKRKPVDEQLCLIRRQLRVSERNAATATEQANTLKRMVDIFEMQVENQKRSVCVAEAIAAGIKERANTAKRMEAILEKFAKNVEK